MESIELGISVDSVHEWTVEDAVRDLIQNWLDNPNYSSYLFHGDRLHLFNKDTVLDKSALVIGSSSKRDDDSQRGRHGDGLKSAMACLLREGVSLKIRNGPITWHPSSRYSSTFDQSVVTVDMVNYADYDDCTHLEFIISGLSEEQIVNIKKNTLAFCDMEGKTYSTSRGDILKGDDQKGRIYCGGLYVATVPSLDYGYDFKQEYLSLDRDRKAVDSFDVKWQTKEMWNEYARTGPVEGVGGVAAMIYKDSSDTEYLSHAVIPESLATAVVEVYDSEMKGSVLADSAEDARKLRASGYRNVEFLNNDAFTKIVKRSSSYQKFSSEIKVVLPEELLDKWYHSWEHELSKLAEDSFFEMREAVSQLTK